MTWDKIWSKNRSFIDPTSVRYHAVPVSNAIVLKVINVTKNKHQVISTKKHPKYDDPNYKGEPVIKGYKSTIISNEILLEGTDLNEMKTSKGEIVPPVKSGDKITLIDWGNILVTDVTVDSDNNIASLEGEYIKGDNDYASTVRKLQWVANTDDKINITVHEYGYLLKEEKVTTDDDGNFIDSNGNITEFEHFLTPLNETHATFTCWAEAGVKLVAEDDIVQFQRLGYFRCDKSVKDGAHFFTVPDGKTKSMSNRKGLLDHQ
jgi:glutamyl-tRNA synthetase